MQAVSRIFTSKPKWEGNNKWDSPENAQSIGKQFIKNGVEGIE
ncbi:MAG: hypothetical protein AVDCRST_MAG95-270 [uncultured Adhaeribacter sp.]|uniref:Uncharacterized protein n=1 Tax=uncultured Adhaeribacter sp. TaxID=448109 RepID=A0A6J4H5A9_9BACT|nr:MAG: hypothetical protein AVDCRST_MAG95-270 [uncultured Adhaeribacter sp.]